MLDAESRLALKVAILKSGKHQYQIAKEIGVNENGFSAFLCGRRSLPPEKLARLEEALGLTTAVVGAGDPDGAA
jgi:transcriptional regulator with XRE-family HTH domain